MAVSHINPVLIWMNRNCIHNKKHQAISEELCKGLMLSVIGEMANGSLLRVRQGEVLQKIPQSHPRFVE